MGSQWSPCRLGSLSGLAEVVELVVLVLAEAEEKAGAEKFMLKMLVISYDTKAYQLIL